jgi:hypothetical protein
MEAHLSINMVLQSALRRRDCDSEVIMPLIVPTLTCFNVSSELTVRPRCTAKLAAIAWKGLFQRGAPNTWPKFTYHCTSKPCCLDLDPVLASRVSRVPVPFRGLDSDGKSAGL